MNINTLRRARPMLLAWALWSLLLHLGWEIAQLPLYTGWRDPDVGHVVWSVIHCTVGDVLIALSTFLLTTICLRRVDWPARAPLRGLPILLASGVAYTAFSEWRNVHVLGGWQYAETMPTLGGIGVSPLAQWLVVPTLTLWVVLRRSRPISGAGT
jgi:hypothetical protein